MKFLFLIILTIFLNFANAQNIEYDKIIDKDVDIPEYYWLGLGFNYIRYYKLPNDNILRIEDLKVQLLNSNSEIVWKKDFERILGGTKKFNRIEIEANESYIYVSQHSYSMKKPGIGKEVFKLFKVDFNGTILKETTFSEINPIEGINKMEVIGDDLYIISFTSPVGKGFNINYDNYTHITRLDKDLNLKGEILQLPFYIEGSEYEGIWVYTGVIDDKFTFKRAYGRDNDGIAEKCYNCTVSEDEVELYTVDYELKNSELTSGKMTEKDFEEMFLKEFKYDVENVELYSGDNSFSCGGGITTRINTKEDESSIPLTLKSKGKSSPDIISFLAEKGFDILSKGSKLYVHGLIENPVTGGVTMYLSPNNEGTFGHIISFDSELEITAVNVINNIGFMPFEQNLPYSFVFGFTNFRDGKIFSEDKTSAFEYAIENSVKNQNTIINYDNYQLLFIDDRKAKVCRVLKFVR